MAPGFKFTPGALFQLFGAHKGYDRPKASLALDLCRKAVERLTDEMGKLGPHFDVSACQNRDFREGDRRWQRRDVVSLSLRRWW